MIRNGLLTLFSLFASGISLLQAQTPRSYSSADILQKMQQLNVLGSVLYIAAHPDDENTRLLAYLANEKKYRTGYLSLTRGDGGQNLIGDEQGVDLGIIRTQELLAARRIDGAEQFFSRAYDFGFSKSSDEALAVWGHEKILSDVVWVIRKFQPDVLIARFPEDSRAGHGHHAASGILAREAFDAAGDPSRFPEQLKYPGIQVWQPKRLLWNTFNFGGGNTTSEDQFKLDAGSYNVLLGKSYGEIAALSRSQHKSQGFGVPAQRGTQYEYFTPVRGDQPTSDLLEGISTGWHRLGKKAIGLHTDIDRMIERFNPLHPEASLPVLMYIHQQLQTYAASVWTIRKIKEVEQLIEWCSGLYLDATVTTRQVAQGDSLMINLQAIARLPIQVKTLTARFAEKEVAFDSVRHNQNQQKTIRLKLADDAPLTQPYWLVNPMEAGAFNVHDQTLIGLPENIPASVQFQVQFPELSISIEKPVRYKFTDPVKGELYQPLDIVPPVTVSVNPVLSVRNGIYELEVKAWKNQAVFSLCNDKGISLTAPDTLMKGQVKKVPAPLAAASGSVRSVHQIFRADKTPYREFKLIQYDHIPGMGYTKPAQFTRVQFDYRIAGKRIGYIPGAGDKVPQALEDMGYEVVLLREADINLAQLGHFDAIVTGIRAYNTNEWMGNVHTALMEYVKNGGTLLVQYNTNNFISSVKSKIGPAPFVIGRNRITDETAAVEIVQPTHPVFNYPNKITPADFEGWIQERSIYHAELSDSTYTSLIRMHDPNDKPMDGSLITMDYGKGRFIYTGLVFFRELPAGVPGAYRLIANLLAPRNEP